MKRYLVFLLLIILGCQGQPKDSEVLAKVNDYRITCQDFQRDFKESAFGQEDTLESRQKFLTNLINQKLILQEAQREGLDKNNAFLRMIEKFWEQSLLKTALDKKAEELSKNIRIDDKEVLEAYQAMQKETKTDKTYQQMYGLIKWELAKKEEARLLDQWINDLNKGACIKINENLLKKR